jgi:predicted Zn-dependent protease
MISTRQKLSLLSKPLQKVPKGKYKVFLEPMAVAEIVGLLAWGAFSLNGHNQGRAPLKKLKDKENLFNKKFSMIENLDLGYTPAFNTLGELATKQLPLIENGELKNMLISTASSQEYKVPSNFAEPSETFKSIEIRAGALEKSKILKELGNGLYLSNLHYINWSDIQTARLTGMTRFACFWVENGEIVGPIQDLRFDETIYNLFGAHLVDLTNYQENFTSTETYLRRSLGGMKIPGAMIDSFNFTL